MDIQSLINTIFTIIALFSIVCTDANIQCSFVKQNVKYHLVQELA